MVDACYGIHRLKNNKSCHFFPLPFHRAIENSRVASDRCLSEVLFVSTILLFFFSRTVVHIVLFTPLEAHIRVAASTIDIDVVRDFCENNVKCVLR